MQIRTKMIKDRTEINGITLCGAVAFVISYSAANIYERMNPFHSVHLTFIPSIKKQEDGWITHNDYKHLINMVHINTLNTVPFTVRQKGTEHRQDIVTRNVKR